MTSFHVQKQITRTNDTILQKPKAYYYWYMQTIQRLLLILKIKKVFNKLKYQKSSNIYKRQHDIT